jgi:hypothetical protein
MNGYVYVINNRKDILSCLTDFEIDIINLPRNMIDTFINCSIRCSIKNPEKELDCRVGSFDNMPVGLCHMLPDGSPSNAYMVWADAMANAAASYNELKSLGVPESAAAQVLPLNNDQILRVYIPVYLIVSLVGREDHPLSEIIKEIAIQIERDYKVKII